MEDLKFIITTCSGREHFVEELLQEIPQAIVNFDDFPTADPYKSTAYRNWRRSLSLAGDSPVVMLEDDIILCDNFQSRIKEAIAERPDEVIQFFSMRKDDLLIGSRYLGGSSFLMLQCYYLPAGVAKGVWELSDSFAKDRPPNDLCPSDPCVAEYMRRNKMKYWLHVPNLVDHRVTKSRIDPRRSSKRQSKTFKK